MTKNKRIAFTVPEELWKGLSALAGTFGVSAEEVIRLSLPDDAVVGLFFQCRVYEPELRWDEVARAGQEAIRERLRTAYMQGLREHLGRLGVDLESSAEEVETAKRRVLDEIKADAANPLEHQIARAEEDSVYLGCLYEAWKRAKTGEPGYRIAEVDVAQPPSAGYSCESPPRAGVPQRAWAVLKDDQII